MHFDKLNYSFANETTDIELSAMPENAHSVFCIAGSGSRFTPLLSKNPVRMDVVDSSVAQLYIAELRYQAIKQLDFESYLKLLGYKTTTAHQRLNIFLSLDLKEDLKIFWLEKNTNWQKKGFIFIGSWEKKLQWLRRVFFLFHFKKLGSTFNSKSPKNFPMRAWNLFCRFILNESLVRKLLYSDQSKYNLPLPFSEFVNQQFKRQILKAPLDRNFFLQFLFCGNLLSPDSWPIEADSNIFEQAKKSTTKVSFVLKNLNEIKDFGYDFYSLSDCFSYLSDDDSQNFLNKIKASGVKVNGVIRYFMYHPDIDFSHFQYSENDYSNQEYVPIYKIIHFST